MKEISFITTLDHSNTVKYFGSYLKGQYIWMVMEYCIGSASDIIEFFKEGLTEDDISAIISETVEGLAYLHQNNKIHRFFFFFFFFFKKNFQFFFFFFFFFKKIINF